MDKFKKLILPLLLIVGLCGGILFYNHTQKVSPISRVFYGLKKINEYEEVESISKIDFEVASNEDNPMIDIINNFEFKVTSKGDKNNRVESLTEIIYEENKITDISLAFDGKNLILSSPELLEQVIYFETENAKNYNEAVEEFDYYLKGQFGVNSGLKTIDKEMVVKAIDPNNYESYKEVDKKKYSKVLEDLLTEILTVTEDQKVIINKDGQEKEVVCAKISFSLNNNNIKPFLKKVAIDLKEVSKDEDLKLFIKEYFKNIIEMTYEANGQVNQFNEEEFKAEFDRAWEQMKTDFENMDILKELENMDEINNEFNFSLDFYLDSDNIIRKLNIIVDVKDNEEDMKVNVESLINDGEGIDFNKFDIANGINIKELNQLELQEMFAKIQYNIQRVILENPSLQQLFINMQ